MKIEDIDDLIGQYHALEKAVFHAAKTHLPEGPSKRYAELNEFYVSQGKVQVSIVYGGSYSGRTDVELLAEEIAFAETLVKIEQPARPEGEGWHHRIDRVPSVGREVELVLHNGAHMTAVVERNCGHDPEFGGIGYTVIYNRLSKSGVKSGEVTGSRLVHWWRYLPA